MYCTKCGNEVGQNAYCPHCGCMIINSAVDTSSNGDGSGLQGADYDGAEVESFNLISAYKSMFKKYAQFSGRSRRSEYWYATLANFLVIFIAEIIFAISAALAFVLGEGFSGGMSVFVGIMYVLIVIYSLAVIVPLLALEFRRLHDIGKSGWYLLLGLIPWVGSIIILVFTCMDSQPGPNEYGPNPKGK